MSRYRFGAVATALVLVLAACSSNATPSPSGPGGGSTAASAPPAGGESAAPSSAAEAKAGGTLVVGLPSDMVVADSALVQDNSSFYIQENVVESLVALKPGTISEIVPSLATSWDTSADGKTYTFHLRQNVKFHDGTDFNADAVKFNYERWQNLPKELQDTYDYYYGAVMGGWGTASNIESVTASDASTVVVTLKQPQSNFLISQALVPFGIQSPTALQAGDADNPDPSKSDYAQGRGTGMVGTGPFMFKEWTQGDHVTIVKNPDYWDTSAGPYLDSVVFRTYSDQTATLNALQSGDLDVALTVAAADLTTVANDPQLQLLPRGTSCNEGDLGINQTFPQFQNKDLRQAIAYALNRASYVDAFYGGQAQVSDSWMPSSIANYKPENLPTYDPAKAKDIIAKSGLTGDQLTLDLWYPSDFARPYNPNPKALFEAVARDLEAVGFKVVPHTADWKAGYLTDMTSSKLPLFFHGWTCDWGTADNFLFSGLFGYSGEGKPNPIYSYTNDALNQTMLDAIRATSEGTAGELWAKAQDMIAADMPSIPLVNSIIPGVAQAYVKGYIGAGNLLEPLKAVWVDK